MTINNQNLQSYYNQNNINDALGNISSNEPNLDGSAQMIYDKLRSELNGASQIVQNLNQTIGYLNIADGALNSISENTMDINTKLVQLNSGILNNSQKKMIQSSINANVSSIKNIINTTSYNGVNVFSNNNIQLSSNALEKEVNKENLDAFTQQLQLARVEVGSKTNSAKVAIENNHNYMTNLSKAKDNFNSSLEEDILELTQASLLQKVKISTQKVQYNIQEQNIHSLLG